MQRLHRLSHSPHANHTKPARSHDQREQDRLWDRVVQRLHKCFPRKRANTSPPPNDITASATGQIDKRAAAESYGKQHHRDGHQDACHFEPGQPPLRCAAEAHIGTGQQSAGHRRRRKHPKVHDCAPSSLVIFGTLLRFDLVEEHPALRTIDTDDNGIWRCRCVGGRQHTPCGHTGLALCRHKSTHPIKRLRRSGRQRVAQKHLDDLVGVADDVPGHSPTRPQIPPLKLQPQRCTFVDRSHEQP